MKNLLVVLLLIVSCSNPSERRFITMSIEQTGVDFANTLTPDTTLNILNYLYYYNGAGVASADFNNDGLVDLYFTANQTSDKLYLNTGSFTFQDITEQAGLSNADGWTTGVTVVDINADGFLDIYVSKVGKYGAISGKNLLYVNKGKSDGQEPEFSEQAAAYGLDLVGFSTQAVFFDYDLDGDLDLFQLNHSVHPNRSYGLGTKRQKPDTLSGDKLFENRERYFIDVSEHSGIYQGNIGYGLGVSVADINNDGYPDLYVGNDFFENDYLYINQKNNTFKDIIATQPEKLGHTSHYSMGNALADINNDGLADIISLDMLPSDIGTYNTSGQEYPFTTYSYYLKKGYSPQYMQNTLHLNKGEEHFAEVGHLAGIAATEWSWASLVFDMDMDGYNDLYVTNGIKGATNDMDYVNFIAQHHIQDQLGENINSESLDFANKMPVKKLENYAFKNNGKGFFEDISEYWFEPKTSFSHGAAYADLDNDGDLDIVVNNVDEPAALYQNTSDRYGAHYLKIGLKGVGENTFGIGAKLIVKAGGKTITTENHVAGPYLSSIAPIKTIGVGNALTVDSLTVIWPGGAYQSLQQVMTDTLLVLSQQDASGNYYHKPDDFQNTGGATTVQQFPYLHKEEATLEFDRNPLVPFVKTNEGPVAAVADVNNDGLQDVYLGGAKWQQGQLFLQQKGGEFQLSDQQDFVLHAKHEDTYNVFFDADGDGDQDLLVASGGNEFQTGEILALRLYVNQNAVFTYQPQPFGGLAQNVGVIAVWDFDKDGDKDIAVGTNTVAGEFGKSGLNYIFQNEGDGFFTDVTSKMSPIWQTVGLIEDIAVADVDANGYDDLIVAGSWMPVSVFYNDNTQLQYRSIDYTHGWWNTVKAADFDRDGDIDFIAGNWGLNTRLSASRAEPLRLYRYDFDDNGAIESIISYYYKGQHTLLASKDDLVKRLPSINKKFLSYKSFAEADISSVFSKRQLASASTKDIYEFGSCYFENKGDNTFEKIRLPDNAQVSSVQDILVDDVDGDGWSDVLLVGNMYEMSTQLGRLDALRGEVLINDKQGFFIEQTPGQSLHISGAARDIRKIDIDGKVHYLITMNNDYPVLVEKNITLYGK